MIARICPLSEALLGLYRIQTTIESGTIVKGRLKPAEARSVKLWLEASVAVAEPMLMRPVVTFPLALIPITSVEYTCK